MKYLDLCAILLILCCSLAEINSFPIEDQHPEAVLLPEYIKADFPLYADSSEASTTVAVPLTLLNLEDEEKTSADSMAEYQQRHTRGLGFGGFGGFGGLSNKFGGLGLGFKSFGNLGNWGLGGLHGLGLGGYKPFFGKFFG